MCYSRLSVRWECRTSRGRKKQNRKGKPVVDRLNRFDVGMIEKKTGVDTILLTLESFVAECETEPSRAFDCGNTLSRANQEATNGSIRLQYS